ncbi:MAG: flagellar biosynthetic protein FliR [Deltaproteobacteria bacterium]|nr:flagellar biosynthetic protein FliR [Deltaproteobacteria bacterium]
MDLPIVSAAPIIAILLIMSRVLALVSMLPLTGTFSVYDPVKVGLGLFMALVVVAFRGVNVTELPRDLPGLVAAMGGEILLGLAMGFTVRVAMEAVNIAGAMAGFQMGFTIANVVDPVTGDQVSVIATFQMLAAALIFFLGGLFNVFVEGVLRSFEIVGPGLAQPGAAAFESFTSLGSAMFVNALAIGAPWILVLLVVKIGFGLVARTFPQMNVFFVGFPVTVALGFVIISVGMPMFFASVLSVLGDTPGQFWTLVKASTPGVR